MKGVYDSSQVLELLKEKLGKKTQREFAAEVGITQQYLNDLLHGRRSPGPKVLEFLGLEGGFFCKIA